MEDQSGRIGFMWWSKAASVRNNDEAIVSENGRREAHPGSWDIVFPAQVNVLLMKIFDMTDVIRIMFQIYFVQFFWNFRALSF